MRVLSFFWCLLLLPTWLSAQVYNVTRYSTDDGLVQSQVMALLQDRWGYLWLGTHRGAAKFDGRQFYDFGTEEGLSSTFLADLAEDPKGGIWMATDDGLSFWDGVSFVNYHREDGLPDNDIQCLRFDRDSSLWLGTRSQGVARYRAGRFDQPLAYPDSQATASVQDLLEDAQGRLWVGTLDGLLLSDPAKSRLTHLPLPQAPPNTEVHALLQARDGRIWIGTTQGVWVYDEAEGFAYHRLDQPAPPSRAVYCLAEDHDGHIWLGTGNGLIRHHDGRFTPLQRGDRLLAYRMASACVDYEGSLWFGTDGGGVRKVTEGIFQSYGMKDKLSSNLAKSFLQDAQGRIWISTKDRGINLFDQGKLVDHFTVADGLGGDDICSSYADQAGQFWFASYNGTLTRYAAGRFTVFDRRQGLNCNAVYWVTEGPGGQLYACTDNGIFRWQGERFAPFLSREQGLIDNTVYTLLIDRKRRFWIGTSAGLMVGRPDSLMSYLASEVVGNNVITLLKDPIGRIWVGSSVGLTCFSGGKPEQVRISGAPGAHTVVGLVMENMHYLWIGTENGAYRLELESYQAGQPAQFEHYTQKDGLPSLECNANAAFQDQQGDIWLGTAEGAIHRPAGTERRDSEVQPRVYITHVRAVADQSWTAMGYPVNAFGLPEEPVLPYTENRLDFTYIGISLRSPQQVEYRFMMEGVDQDWLRATRQTSVFYPNLDPGAYTFKVMAKKESEPWDHDQYASFRFVIRPPFWRTWWFISLMSLLLLGGGYGVYQSYAQRRRRHREQMRLQNAAEKLQLEHQALYAMMNPHFTFNALQSIQFFIHRQDRKSANKFLSSFAKLVRKNLESTRVDFISLSEEVERLRLYLSLEKMRFPEKFDYEVTLDYGSDLGEVQLPPMLLQPFVENSIKHGIMPLEQDGLIRIEIAQLDEDYLRILIEDNGIGLSVSQARRANRPNDHVSKGMQITKDRLALFARISGKQYGLDIRERHRPDGSVAGTTVEIVLPIRQEEILVG